MATEKESKLEAGVPNSKLKVPPKSCIPRRAKMRMKRKRRRRRDTMDFMEARRETTRFLKEDQYLDQVRVIGHRLSNCLLTHLVTLKILRSLRARRTERPKEPALGLKWVQITSKTLPLITRQSNLTQWAS